MKVTVEIPAGLLRAAKAYAARHGITFRDVFESGLRRVVEGAPGGQQQFRLKTVTTKGKGVAGIKAWSSVRSRIYEGHGG